MTTLSLPDARARLTAIFEAHNTSADNAASVAAALVAAEADGLKGHGFSRVPTYAAQSAAGKVDGFATPSATARGAVLAVDAAHGFAYPAIALALEALPDLARQNGVAIAALSRSHHCGALGHPVEALADEGLVALMFANTPVAIAPWGGKRGLFGTNPIAFAAPLGDETVVVDLSLSKVARGNVVKAAQDGTPIPEGWALDADGNPTTDAKAALSGTMVPMGDAKGVALALMVEVLAAGVTGAHFSFEASSFLNTKGGPPAVGQLIIAIDPAATGGSGAHLGRLAAAYADEPGARLPGARRKAARLAAARDGLTLPKTLIAMPGGGIP
ncbi:MAG: Ldh family oxidoreductase [Pseudomonadota bacterium]